MMKRKRNVTKKTLRHGQSRKPVKRRKPKVKMEDPAMREMGFDSRTLEPIPIMTEYKIGGKKAFVGDYQLARMKATINRVATSLDIGKPQRENAFYIYTKARKEGIIIKDFEVAAHALLFAAGRQMGLSQSIKKFQRLGKSRLFLEYLRRFKVTPRSQSPIEIMAYVNERAVHLPFGIVNKSAVNQALQALGGLAVSRPGLWVYLYIVSRQYPKWYPSVLGKQEAVSKGFGVKVQAVRDYFSWVSQTKTGEKAQVRR